MNREIKSAAPMFEDGPDKILASHSASDHGPVPRTQRECAKHLSSGSTGRVRRDVFPLGNSGEIDTWSIHEGVTIPD